MKDLNYVQQWKQDTTHLGSWGFSNESCGVIRKATNILIRNDARCIVTVGAMDVLELSLYNEQCASMRMA